jgi:hypothetical protein
MQQGINQLYSNKQRLAPDQIVFLSKTHCTGVKSSSMDFRPPWSWGRQQDPQAHPYA